MPRPPRRLQNPLRQSVRASKRGADLQRRFIPPNTDNQSWCRVRMWDNETNQVIPTDTETQMHFNDVQSDDPNGVFTGAATDSLFDGITINFDGLYLIKARAYWASGAGPPSEAQIMLNGIDGDRFAPYPGAGLFVDELTTVHVMTFARLTAEQDIAVTVLHKKGSDAELYGSGGNFLEIARIGSATVDAINGGP